MEIRRMAAALAAAAFFSGVVPAEAGWTYTETNKVVNGVSTGYLTDGIWTFGAERAKNTQNLTARANLGSCTATEPCPIDFTTLEGGYAVVTFHQLSSQHGEFVNTGRGSKLYSYRGLVSEFIAPDCVSITGEGCFKDCANLTKVVVNANVSIAAGRMFENCTSLSELYPRSFSSSCGTTIFGNCTSLTGRIELTKAATLSQSLFSGCTALEEVIATNATNVGEGCFRNCSGMTNCVFSPQLSIVYNGAFTGCAKLQDGAIQAILASPLTQLGKTQQKTVEGDVFSKCTGLVGPLVWNLPSLTTNAVPGDCFANCTSLSQVVFKTSVNVIYGNAFYNVAPGAELYLQDEPPGLIGRRIFTNDNPPYPRVYLRGNFEEWYAAIIRGNDYYHHIVRKADFNNTSWVSPNRPGITWNTHAKGTMLKDTSMCVKNDDGTVKVLDKKVIAFFFYDNGKGGAWILRTPKIGLSVIVR